MLYLTNHSMIRLMLIISAAVLCAGCMRAELRKTRDLRIKSASIASVPDGSYTGSYAYGGFSYTVRCIVADGRVTKIKILRNRSTRHAKMAEAVVQRVVDQQTVNVDVVTGATSTSKAFLKAVEKALAKGASRSNQ